MINDVLKMTISRPFFYLWFSSFHLVSLLVVWPTAKFDLRYCQISEQLKPKWIKRCRFHLTCSNMAGVKSLMFPLWVNSRPFPQTADLPMSNSHLINQLNGRDASDTVACSWLGV